jgi:hypothetical protein
VVHSECFFWSTCDFFGRTDRSHLYFSEALVGRACRRHTINREAEDGRRVRREMELLVWNRILEPCQEAIGCAPFSGGFEHSAATHRCENCEEEPSICSGVCGIEVTELDLTATWSDERCRALTSGLAQQTGSGPWSCTGGANKVRKADPSICPWVDVHRYLLHGSSRRESMRLTGRNDTEIQKVDMELWAD